MTHSETRCRDHGTVLAQCRCPSPTKTVTEVPCPGTCQTPAEPPMGARITVGSLPPGTGPDRGRSSNPLLPQLIASARLAEVLTRENDTFRSLLAALTAAVERLTATSPTQSDVEAARRAVDRARDALAGDVTSPATQGEQAAEVRRLAEELRQAQLRHLMAETEVGRMKIEHAAELREVNGLLTEARAEIARLREGR